MRSDISSRCFVGFSDNPEEAFVTLSILPIVIPIALLVPFAAQAGSNRSRDGTWSGTLNNSEPVSVTIAEGKVVGYTIRGAAPYPIRFSTVTLMTVSFGDRVKLHRED